MAQDTNIENLIINKLTKAQYESIANPDPAQLYFITDEVISSSDVVNALGYTPENVVNKTTTLSSSSTDTQYPSAKAVYDQIANIDTLPSQTGQSGKFLTTDGTDASWGNLPVATASTVGVVKPDNASIRVDNDGTLSAICRNVGEIITSTLPLTDAGLHLLDGSLLQYGIYKEFIDYIAELHTSNPNANYFCTETEWQTSVTTYGSCGKFVYDSTLNTVRLPKVSDILQGTTDVSALGDLVEAGLPNITGELDYLVRSTNTVDVGVAGAFYDNGVGRWQGGNDTQSRSNVGFNASRSSSVYGNSTTVQPQTIKAFVYIVIANSTKTDIQVDIDEIATDLNGKANVDASNFNSTGTTYLSGLGMPSGRYIDLTLGASGSTYTAPANGWFVQNGSSTRADQRNVFVKNGILQGIYSSSASQTLNACVEVLKGESITFLYSITPFIFRFIYAKGSESEAS